MREQRAGLPFIVVLHCLRPRATLWGSNNFLTSSRQMQTIPGNGTGCVLVSCTAAFWFPGLCHVISHMKASVSVGMRGLRISGAQTRRHKQKAQIKCWWHPLQAGDVCTWVIPAGLFVAKLSGNGHHSHTSHPDAQGPPLESSCHKWSPARPQQSPHLLMFPWLYVSVQIFA